MYSITWFTADNVWCKALCARKSAALKLAAQSAANDRALVRVATPAGNLVRYFDGRVVS